MDINTIFGLPAHPLLVHVPVVLIPLAFVGSLLLLKPSWRRMYAIPVAVIAVVGAGGVFLAAKSGETLEERVKESNLVDDHKVAGENAEPFVAVFAILAVGVAVADQVQRRQGDEPADGAKALIIKAVPVLTVLTVLSGAVASYMVYEAGHSGAKATWTGTKLTGGEGGLGALVPDTVVLPGSGGA